MRKKNKLCIVAIFVVITICVFVCKKIYRNYRIAQIESDILDYLNLKPNERIAQEGLEELDRYVLNLDKYLEEKNNYDITNLVNKYIEEATKSVELAISGDYEKMIHMSDDYWYKNFANIDPHVREDSGSAWRFNSMAYIEAALEIKDVDIKNYKNGIFKENLVEDLKHILDYKIEDGGIKWHIKGNYDKEISLPYGFCIEYKPYKTSKNDNIDKIISCTIVNKEKVNLNEEMLCRVKYLTKSGNEEGVTLGIEISKIDKNKRYTDLTALYTNYDIMGTSIYLTHFEAERKSQEANEKQMQYYD